MLVFPNAKINIGLYVLGKRPDGFHNISGVFYPISLCDVLEFVEAKEADAYHFSGFPIPGNPADNLCAKALKLLRKSYKIPPLDVYLHKAIPMGAGLGGGSSDAAYFIKSLNIAFELGIDPAGLKSLAAELGSDCAFFIDNEPALAEGRGELLRKIDLDLSGKHIVVVGPGVHISTPEAYKQVSVGPIDFDPGQVLQELPLASWKDQVANAFEKFSFEKYPEMKQIKADLYGAGAEYVSMTGSGSAIYGIFSAKPAETALDVFAPYFVYQGVL